MKKDENVPVIGAAPIIVGQAAEFDYSGTQARRALREQGVTSGGRLEHLLQPTKEAAMVLQVEEAMNIA